MNTTISTQGLQRRPQLPQVFSRVTAHAPRHTGKLGIEFFSEETTLCLPAAAEMASGEESPQGEQPPLWSVDLQVLIPGAPQSDAPFFTIASGEPDKTQSVIALCLKETRVNVAVATPDRRLEIFRDPRAFSIGTWQRFKLAVRFGSERYGLAHLLHDDVLIATYSGALGAPRYA